MLQAYSSNLSVGATSAFPFNNVTVDKGCAETLSAPATIQLNQRGVYLVEVDGYASGAADGISNVQLNVNGVAYPQAISEFTTATTTISGFGFKTFVQVTTNNCPCNCVTSPTVLQVVNGPVAVTDAHINIVVTKIR